METRTGSFSTVTLAVIVGFFVLSGSARAGEVVLTSEDVASAVDIEQAIDEATNFGAEAGLVLLDGGKGDFLYSGLDRSINIADRSNFELRGINGATLANCDDGLFFDGGFATQDITIRRITFNCDGNGIREGGPPGPKRNVVVAGNTFQVSGSGILATNAADWSVRKNSFVATGDLGVIGFFDSLDVKIVNNTMEGTAGVRLVNSLNTHLTNNSIITDRDGVRLADQASANKVIANSVAVVASPAVFLDASTFDNKIHGNVLAVDDGGEPLVDLGFDNKVTGMVPH